MYTIGFEILFLIENIWALKQSNPIAPTSQRSEVKFSVHSTVLAKLNFETIFLGNLFILKVRKKIRGWATMEI